MAENVTSLPVRHKNMPKTLEPVQSFGGCAHQHALVDRELNELECADCHAKLNPIEFLYKLACKATSWEFEKSQIAKVRAELEERKRCRCTKCGQMTEIKRGRASFR